jgi:hypothetical protein
MIVVGGNMLDGLWFETWRKLYRRGFLDYCSSVVWQVGSFGGLVESPNHNNMLCGRFQPYGWTSNGFSW